MHAQTSDDVQSPNPDGANKFSPLILVAFFISLIATIILYSLYIYRDYQTNKGDRSFGEYLQDATLGKIKNDCTYEMSKGPQAFPLTLEADVEILDRHTIRIKSPLFCSNKFEYTVEIGDFGRPVTKVYTLEGLKPDDEGEVYKTGYPNVTPYYIGDMEAYKNGQSNYKIIDRGPLSDLYGSDKQYTSKKALVTFYRHGHVFFNGDRIYVTEVFFNEK